MNIDTLLSHFDGVKKTGHDNYVARCSAHDDRNPSLAISEGDGGRLLLKCWAGCETEDVLSAVGLKFADVMPERIGAEHSYKPLKFDVRQVLAGISHEIMVVCLIADRLSAEANEEDQARLILAAGRLNNALEMSQSLCTPPEIKRIRRGES